MTEFGLTLLRLSFLAGLWIFVIATVLILRRDLAQPREARTATSAPTRRTRPPKQPKPARAPRSVGPSLLVTDGPLSGTVIPLGTSQITLGRAPDSTIVIDDDFASSRHARIPAREPGSWRISDRPTGPGSSVHASRHRPPFRPVHRYASGAQPCS